MNGPRLYTIGFTKTDAESFFETLGKSNVRRVIDVRLNNSSQLSGFAKRDDLRYFLKSLHQIDYLHLLDLAPTSEMLDTYKKYKGSWEEYEQAFLELIHRRQIEQNLPPELIDGACLLCSEDTPEHCHRRLVAEYLLERDPSLTIEHLRPGGRGRRVEGGRV
ncbi:MAG TPA: DUF488 domain-containing protein [Planctomycetaceae bacterium]|nr:DUF488 domain-containing protein [Planctomycetaceae bacterium]